MFLFHIIYYNFDYQSSEMDYQTSLNDHQTNAYSYYYLCSLESWILWKEGLTSRRYIFFRIINYNFGYQSSGMDYQIPPNDHQSNDHDRYWILSSGGANFTQPKGFGSKSSHERKSFRIFGWKRKSPNH